VGERGWVRMGDLHDRLLAQLLDGRVVEDLAVLDDAVVALRVRVRVRARARARVRVRVRARVRVTVRVRVRARVTAIGIPCSSTGRAPRPCTRCCRAARS
jgi:hypothetical protein